MKIALDVDDVLAAFCAHTAAYFGKPLIKQHYWCTKTMDAYLCENWFDRIKDDEVFWASIPVLSSPEDIDFEVACYMSSFPEKMHRIREGWLWHHKFPYAPLVVASKKLEKCVELGIDVLVDDKPATIESLQGSAVKGIHFITPYAGFEPVGDHVITSLTQVKNHL